MKKFLSALLVIGSLLVLAACQPTFHTHSYEGEWQYDDNYHYHLCECGIKDTSEAHDFGTTYQKDANNHWLVCKCGKTSEVTAHTWDNGVVTTEAGDETTGIMTYTCTVCSETKEEVIPAKGHTYGAWIEAIDPTCEEAGQLGHYLCTCGKYFDINFNELTTIVVDALGHNYGELVAEVAADCANAGLKAHYKCSVCEEYFDIEKNATTKEALTIEALGHAYGEWVQEVPAQCGVEGVLGHYQCSTCEVYFDAEKNVLESLTIKALEHKLSVVNAKAPTCTEAGNVSYFHCELCEGNFVYSSDAITLPANSGWDSNVWPVGNFFPTDTYIVADNTNTSYKLQPKAWGQLTGLKKDSGKALTNAGTYVLEFDVKSSSAVEAVSHGKIDIHFFYNGGKVMITDGVYNLATISNTEWTTLMFEFVVPEGIVSDYTNIDFYYWPEKSLEDNYVLVDNICVYAKGDESKTNLDNLGMNDFEGYIGKVSIADVVIPAGHTYGELVAEVPATCEEDGFKSHYKCIACDKYFDAEKNEVTYESLVILAAGIGHTYGELVAEVPATCTEAGVAAHYQCSVCDKYFDAEKNAVSQEELVLKSLGHDLVYVAAKASTCTVDGNIAHFECGRCNTKFSDEVVTVKAGDDWDKPLFAYSVIDSANNFYVVNDGPNNSALKIQTVHPWPQFNTIKKNVPNTLNIAGARYRILVDVKLGSNPALNTSKLDIQYWYPNSSNNFSVLPIVDGNVLSTCSSEEWTTLEYTFALPTDISTGWANLAFYYWSEGVLGADNYILVDNIRLVAADDETNTNLASYGTSDFEGIVAKNVITDVVIPASHNYGELVVEVPATCTENGVKAHYLCSVCNTYFTEDMVATTLEELTIISSGSNHEYGELVAEVVAKCEVTGLKAHYRCSICDAYFNENQEVVLYEDLVIPALEHNIVYVAAKEATVEERGHIAHYACSLCGQTYLYSNDVITFGAQSEWNVRYPWGNYSDAVYYLMAEGANSYIKVQPVVWGQVTGFIKDTGAALAKPGTYVFNIDVMSGPDVARTSAGKLDIHFNYENGTTIKISDGVFNLGGISSTEWTTLTYEFTVPEGANGTWSSFTFFNWPEQSIAHNYILVDNIRIYAKGDETKTNLDACGRGDLEGFINKVKVDKSVVETHIHVPGDLVEATELVNCAEPGVAAHYRCTICEAYLNTEGKEVRLSDISTVVSHNLTFVPGKAATTEEEGYVDHFHCSVCNLDYVYADEKLTLTADKSWTSSIYPFCTEGSENDSFIVKESNTNAALKVKTERTWPVENIFKKDLNGSLNVVGKTYKLLMDVKAGPDDIVKTCKYNIYYYCPTATGVSTVVISENVQCLTTINKDSWTTLEFTFTIPEGATTGWANMAFIFWSEGALGPDNYILVDNIKIVDATEGVTNLDTIGHGDFEEYLPYVLLSEEDKVIAKIS